LIVSGDLVTASKMHADTTILADITHDLAALYAAVETETIATRVRHREEQPRHIQRANTNPASH
jgi:hypothetical protein